MKTLAADTRPPRLGIIVPCYNEEQILKKSCRQIRALLAELRQEGRVAADSYVCFVDDGSGDRTWGHHRRPECPA